MMKKFPKNWIFGKFCEITVKKFASRKQNLERHFEK